MSWNEKGSAPVGHIGGDGGREQVGAKYDISKIILQPSRTALGHSHASRYPRFRSCIIILSSSSTHCLHRPDRSCGYPIPFPPSFSPLCSLRPGAKTDNRIQDARLSNERMTVVMFSESRTQTVKSFGSCQSSKRGLRIRIRAHG